MKFTEAQLEQAFIWLLAEESIDYKSSNYVRERHTNVLELWCLKRSETVCLGEGFLVCMSSFLRKKLDKLILSVLL